MKLFSYLNEQELDTLFYKKPSAFHKRSERWLLSYALGPALYMPATRPNIYEDLIIKKHAGLTSMVICLEDAIGDMEVERAERLLINEFGKLWEGIEKGFVSEDDLPLIFVRIRNARQIERLISGLGASINLLTGMVIPKFDSFSGEEILGLIKQHSTAENPLYAMPILETKRIIEKETRLEELLAIKRLLDEDQDLILNVRIGATDFCGLYGIRRNPETICYDIAVLRDCIADIINVFLRSDSPYVISGPVWEYFSGKERMLKPQLRRTPFQERLGTEGLKWRTELLDRHLDGLIREILMDIANGLTGKTIIHPSHIKPVQALSVVSYEEYSDAKNIIAETTGQIGVFKSVFSNKMNEIKPHYYWAQKILIKSEVYGVLNEQFTYLDLLKTEAYVFNHK